MFSSVFQGAPYVEIYNSKDAHNCNPNSDKMKFYNELISYSSSTATSFDSDIKSYILKSNSKVSSIEIPSKSKTELRLVQPILALQIKLPETNWSLLIQMVDTSQTKRRIVLTNSVSKLSTQLFCVTVPCSHVPTGIWLNLSVDLIKLMQFFKQATFRSLEGITINSIVSLRRIITVSSRKNITEQFQYSLGVPFENVHIQECGIPIDQSILKLQEESQDQKLKKQVQPQKLKKQVDLAIKIQKNKKEQATEQPPQLNNKLNKRSNSNQSLIKQEKQEQKVKYSEKSRKSAGSSEKTPKPQTSSKRPITSRPPQSQEVNRKEPKATKAQDQRDQIKRSQIMDSIYDKNKQNQSLIQQIQPISKENRPLNTQVDENSDDIVDRLFQKKQNKDPFHDLEVDYQPPKLPNKVIHIQPKGISFINKIGGNTVVQEEKRVQDPEEFTRVVYDPWEDLNIDIYTGVKYQK